MERRDNIRRARRVPVRFRVPGEDKVRSGFTTDISKTGMFIGTTHVLPARTRVRIEINDPESGFVIEGVVARSLRPTPLMRAVQPSGMGVRFLQVDELVDSLFPHASAQMEPVQSPEPASAGGSVSSPSKKSATGDAGGQKPRRGFIVRFRTAADLERTWARDVAQGGIFVSAREPADVGEAVLLEIRPPEDAPAGSKVRLDARVVHRFEPGSGEGGANLLSGMGVEFLDPQAAIGALGTLLGRG